MYRQGDLLFVPFEPRFPLTHYTLGESVTDGVLAEGEATGHAHRVAPEDFDQGKATIYALGPQTSVIEAHEDVSVTHEEHEAITLPAGRWEVRRQREYTPGQRQQGQPDNSISYVAD